MERQKRSFSLRGAALLLAGACLLLFTIAFFIVFYSTMPSILQDVAKAEMGEKLERLEDLLLADREKALASASFMARGEDVARFVQGQNDGYAEEHLPGAFPLDALDYNFLFMWDAEGNLAHTQQYNFMGDEPYWMPASIQDAFLSVANDALAAAARSADATQEEAGLAGLLFYEDEAYLISCAPVQGGGAQPVGSVLLGRRVDDAYLLWRTGFGQGSFVWDAAPTAARLEGATTATEETLEGQLPLQDIYGHAVLLSFLDENPEYPTVQHRLNRTSGLIFSMMLLLALGLYFIIDRLFLNPVERLTHALDDVGEFQRVEDPQRDPTREFQTLVAAINGMLERLDMQSLSMNSLSSILNGMEAFLFVSEPETDEILFMNDKMRALYAQPEDIEGRLCWQVLHPHRTQRCEQCPIDALQEDPAKTVTWEEYSDSTGRCYQNTDGIIEWTDGRPVHIRHSIDITEMKTAQDALAQRLLQQELVAAISQSFIATPDINIFINDAIAAAGRFIDVSKVLVARAEPKKGVMRICHEWYNENQPVKKLASHTFPYVPGEGMYEAFEKGSEKYIAIDDISGHNEHAAMFESGVKSFMTAPLYVAGELWGVISFDECQTAHHWSESDIHLLRLVSSLFSVGLSRSEMEMDLARMSSIVRSSPQYIAYVDRNARFRYVNPGAAQLTGYTMEELYDGGMALIVDEEEFSRVVWEHIPNTLSNGTYEAEFPIRCKDGTARLMHFSSFATGYEEFGIGTIATDVTAQRQMEKDLVAAKDQAEQSSLAKSNFLSRMSHEMRTPMNAIIGMTGIARTTTDAARKEYCLDKIDEASTHLLGVINDILDVSKIEAGKFELSPSEFNVEKMLLRVTNVMNFRIDEKKQNFIVRVEPSVPRTLVADEQRLAQVLTNLLGNAVKFTPDEGTVSLWVRSIGQESDYHILQFEVSDTGIGISAEQQLKLFQSFEQADGGIARKYGGTGLGLAICKNIVEMMGGEIWVDSELGEGATFSLRIPVRQGKEQAAPQLVDIQWDSLNVLAVDDAVEVREYFMQLSQDLGFECAVAEDGFEAFDILEQQRARPFHIVFVDWRLPEMDGIELTRQIKARYGKSTVVIMISAAQWEELETEARAAGVDGFVAKPLFSSLIVDCINNCLGTKQAPAPGPAADPNAGIFAGKRVLMAEDIDVNREIVAALLENTGILIEAAENGKEALQMFQDDAGAYDLILMDIHMPEMDGFEATRRIRALGTPKAITTPIVAMTANVFREDIEKCLAVGMNDHIGKPVDAEEIFAKLKLHLGTVG